MEKLKERYFIVSRHITNVSKNIKLLEREARRNKSFMCRLFLGCLMQSADDEEIRQDVELRREMVREMTLLRERIIREIEIQYLTELQSLCSVHG